MLKSKELKQRRLVLIVDDMEINRETIEELYDKIIREPEEGLSSEADLIPSRRKKKTKKSQNDNPLFRPGRRKKD